MSRIVSMQTFRTLLFHTFVTSLVYFFSGKLVSALSFHVSSSIFAIWPPTGVALLFLLFRGYVVLPGIFLGAFFLNVTLSSPLVAFEIAIGNTLGPFTTYWLMENGGNKTIKNDIFYDTNTIMTFIYYSILGALITSSMGTTMLFLNGLLTSENQIGGWMAWFFGDLIGFILIVPIFMAQTLQRDKSGVPKKHIAEITLILAILVISAVLIFGSGYFFDRHYPIEYLILFPLVWATIRLKFGVNLIFLIIVTVLAILGTTSGYSQFVFEEDKNLSLVMLQLFIFTVTFFILMVTAQRGYTERMFDENEQLTLIDPLTRVGNRRFFTNVLKEELEKTKRYKRPVSLIMLDIDHFKQVNDTFGHEMGDSVLQELSSLLSGQLRSSDSVARWGGEEFTIILPESTLESAIITAEKLRKAIEAYPFSIGQQLTCSFGVIQCSDDESVEKVQKRVDSKLYEAKKTGRNKVVS